MNAKIKILHNGEVCTETSDTQSALVAFMVKTQEAMSGKGDREIVEMRVETGPETHFTRIIREQGEYKTGAEPADQVAKSVVAAEQALGENLTYLTDQLGPLIRSGDKEAIFKLKQLEDAWKGLVWSTKMLGYTGRVDNVETA